MYSSLARSPLKYESASRCEKNQNVYELTVSLALEHLKELLDALIPRLQSLLLGLDASFELLEKNMVEEKALNCGNRKWVFAGVCGNVGWLERSMKN